MRIAAIYDIHGNLPALEAVLHAALNEHVDGLVVGGDVVPGPMPREVVGALLDLPLPVHFLAGNGDHDVLAARRGDQLTRVPPQFHGLIEWCAGELTAGQVAAMESWPLTVPLTIDGIGTVMFCHATPRDDNEIFTRVTPEEALEPVFEGGGADLVVCGHTHMQFDRTIGRVRVVNAGSVGMPFGEPGAYWLLLGPDVDFRCTHYDYAAADARIEATGYPQADSFKTAAPAAEQQMLDVFEKAALR